MKLLIKLFFIIFFLFLFSFVKISFAVINFTISNPTINSDDSIDAVASISGLISSSCSTSGCYLQGELKTLDESKSYFGFTYNNSGEFVDYFSSVSSTDEIKSKLFNFVPVSGAWTGMLKVKNNEGSANYLGPGQYTLRFRRFSGNSITPTTGDSNALTINLTLATPTPTPSPTASPTPSPSPTPIPTSTSTPSPTNSPIPSKTPSVSLTPTPVDLLLEESISDSAVLSTEDAQTVRPTSLPIKTLEKSDNNLYKLFIVLGVIILGVSGILGFLSIRKNGQ